MKKKEKVEITLEYYPSDFDEKAGIYYGGVEEPRYIDELLFDICEDEEFDEEKDDFVKSGKFQLVISGRDKALEELGKYLIAFSRYKTKDPDFHDHFDDIKNSNNEDAVNLIVRKK